MENRTDNSTSLELEELKNNIDDLFLIINGFLVFLMQPGFALLECGAVRSKNATNILIKNLLDCMIAGVAYYLCGYAFAFGAGNSFIGHTHFAAANLPANKHSHWFFQYVFAATAATIVSGSLAERCDTTAYFTYSFVITGFIYPVVAHWAWADEGWLKVSGYYTDFAGSGGVHMLGGSCALVGAVLLGPRIGKFDPDTGEPNDIRGHSVPLTIIGGMLILLGFLPFNGGSLISISEPQNGAILSLVIVNTVISGCFGGLTALVCVRLGYLGRPKVLSGLHSLNGALTGVVAICSGCNNYYPWASAIIGLIAGLGYLTGHVIIQKAKIDDPLDAIPVHLGGGFLGLIVAPLFKSNDGIINSGASDESRLILAWNLAGACAIFMWSSGISFIMFSGLKYMNKLRVDKETEIKGLDIVKHNEPAYPASSWLEEQYVITASQNGRKISVDINLPPHMKLGKLREAFEAFNGGKINKAYIAEEDELKEIPNEYTYSSHM